jgi:hypothetical protein
MAKPPKLPLPSPPAKRRGRPPKPGGPIPAAESQRAYRARLKAAAPALDPAMIDDMREALRDRSLKLELREQDVARLAERNAYLERSGRN